MKFNSNKINRYAYYKLFFKYFNTEMGSFINNTFEIKHNKVLSKQSAQLKKNKLNHINILNNILDRKFRLPSPNVQSDDSFIKNGKKNKKPKIDLSLSGLFIKGTSINNCSTQTNQLSSSPFSHSKNPINIVDLFVPSFNYNKTDEKNNVETAIEKLELTEQEQQYDFEILDFKINNIDDLITLGKQYKDDYIHRKKRYNINLRVLSELVEPLTELNSMIGMKNIKDAIFDKIILYLQGLDNKNKDYQHIALLGGPGLGKTIVAKQIGKIYAKMGFLSKGDFKEIKLTDLKAGYLGQSEIKTQRILDESRGSVLFLDEAYSLGSDDKIDSYSQGILDLINMYLDKYKNDFILIIAGYKDDLNNRFFKGNQGLRSRFGLWLELDDYSGSELRSIFIKKVNEYEWSVKENEISESFFDKNKEYFKYFGRDIEKLFSKCKIAHARRVLYCDPSLKKIINNEDLENGFEMYKTNQDVNFEEKKEMNKEVQYAMYN